jgi:hypothetical protein
MALSFKDEYLDDFPHSQGKNVTMYNTESVSDGHGRLNPDRHWTSSADLVEGDLVEVAPGKFEVTTERYTYRRWDYGRSGATKNSLNRGDILLTRDCQEKDSFGF